jgi:hypothetical protein
LREHPRSGVRGHRTGGVTVTYLRNLSIDQLDKAHEAADYLLKLPARLDAELAIKLDTLRADLTAAIEDCESARRQ